MSRQAPSLALLAGVTALGFCALHMVVPALPIFGGEFGESASRVQLVLTLYLFGIAGGQLVYGPLSDRFGRRPVLIAGLGLFVLGSALCGVAGSLTGLIVGRVLQACGACAGIVLGRAIIRDVYDREAAARGLALVMMVMSLAPAISPALGALLIEFLHWRAIFVLLGAFGAAMLAITVLRLAETNHNPVRLDPLGMVVSYFGLFRSRAFVAFALCSAFTSASWFTFIASAPRLLSDELGQPPRIYGTMILVPMLAYVIGNAAAARFTMRLGSLRMLIWGRVLACAAGLAMAVWCGALGLGVWAMFVPMGFASIGDGLSQPASMAAGLSLQPRAAGAASGLMGFLQMAVASAGTYLVAFLPQQGGVNMLAVVVGAMVLALISAVLAVRWVPGGAAAILATPVPATQAAGADAN